MKGCKVILHRDNSAHLILTREVWEKQTASDFEAFHRAWKGDKLWIHFPAHRLAYLLVAIKHIFPSNIAKNINRRIGNALGRFG